MADEHYKYMETLEKENKEQKETISDLYSRLNEGRSYLMGVDPSEITVEDALKAFGFGRNGLRN